MAASISSKNQKFAEKTQREKAVAVAKDVLKHLYMTDIETGSYLDLDCNATYPIDNLDKESDAQKHINTIARNCHVCAIGACFLSHVRLYDNATVGEVFYADDGNMIEQMKDAFSSTTLRDIERAFEENWGLKNSPEDDKERLRVIMKNVVKNKGEFIPEEGRDNCEC